MSCQEKALSLTHPKKGTFANGQDPDEMMQNVAFHWGLLCVLQKILSLMKEV